MTKRIWVVDYTGRLGNRLKLLTHLAAAAREHGFGISNPAFWKYRKGFGTWRNNALNFFPGGSSLPVSARMERLIRGLACHLARIAPSIPGLRRKVAWLRCPDEDLVDLTGPEFRRRLAGGPAHLFLWGYNFHGAPLVQKHRADLLRLFRPQREPERSPGFTIAMHARRGDYRQWAGGKHYFSWDDYRNWIREARKLWADRSPRILVFSDEMVPGTLRDEAGVEVAGGSPVEDLFRMAGCEVILGPPSSFSDWAAWYGGRGRLRIEAAGQSLRMEDVLKIEAP